eukprot:463749_1
MNGKELSQGRNINISERVKVALRELDSIKDSPNFTEFQKFGSRPVTQDNYKKFGSRPVTQDNYKKFGSRPVTQDNKFGSRPVTQDYCTRSLVRDRSLKTIARSLVRDRSLKTIARSLVRDRSPSLI